MCIVDINYAIALVANFEGTQTLQRGEIQNLTIVIFKLYTENTQYSYHMETLATHA